MTSLFAEGNVDVEMHVQRYMGSAFSAIWYTEWTEKSDLTDLIGVKAVFSVFSVY